MKFIEHLFYITPGAKLTPARGIRTAVAMFLPLIVLVALGQPAFGAMIMLGALFTSFCDLGISYRTRAQTIGIAVIVGALLTALGHALSGPWWLAVPAIFLATLIGGLLPVYGRSATVVGLTLTALFVVSIGSGGGLATALVAAAGYVLGGVFMMLLALAPVVWQRNRPGPAISSDTVPASTRRPALAALIAQFTFTSPLSQHALLRAGGAAVAAGIGWGLGVPYPHWGVLTVIACAWPYKELTLATTVQNIVGTVLGALLAAFLISIMGDPLAGGLMTVGVTVIAFTVKDLNYAIYTFFMTNLTLLLISLPTPDRSFPTELLRVCETLVGAGIVLAVTLLWGLIARRHASVASTQV